MTFITGYKDKKGPYITKYTYQRGARTTIATAGQDILIWNVYMINHHDTSEALLYIYDNAAVFDDFEGHYGTDFLVFKQQLSENQKSLDGGQNVGGALNTANWQLETPILARNGAHILPAASPHPGGEAAGTLSTGLDYFVLYSELNTSTPYKMKVREGAQKLVAGGSNYTSAPSVSFTGGGGTGASASATVNAGAVTAVTVASGNGGDAYTDIPNIVFSGGGGSGADYDAVMTANDGEKQRRDELAPGFITTKLMQHPTTSQYEDRLSKCDCELWGYSMFNNTDQLRTVRIRNGDDNTKLIIPVDEGWYQSGDDRVQSYTGSQGPTLFPVPIFCKNGVKVITLNSTAGGANSTSGVATSILIRELGTNSALTSSNTR